MGEIKPLFSTKEFQTNVKSDNNVISRIELEDIAHEFTISKSYFDFITLLEKLEQNKSYHFVSFGQWSLKHVVFHIINMIGNCDIWSTTYGLGPGSARGIVNMLENKQINSFKFLYDWKIKTYKEEAHYMCDANFPVKLTSIHAKVTVLLNDIWGVAITGSANWSDKNNKIEAITISTHKELALFHKNWIDKAIEANASEPKNIFEEINLKYC